MNFYNTFSPNKWISFPGPYSQQSDSLSQTLNRNRSFIINPWKFLPTAQRQRIPTFAANMKIDWRICHICLASGDHFPFFALWTRPAFSNRSYWRTKDFGRLFVDFHKFAQNFSIVCRSCLVFLLKTPQTPQKKSAQN